MMIPTSVLRGALAFVLGFSLMMMYLSARLIADGRASPWVAEMLQ